MQVFPDGDYDHSHTWQNADDRVQWQRSFQTGTDATRRMATAMIAANPGTTADEIRANMTAPLPVDYGMIKVSPTLDDVLSTGPSGPVPGHLYDHAPTDFSGTPAGTESGPASSLNAY